MMKTSEDASCQHILDKEKDVSQQFAKLFILTISTETGFCINIQGLYEMIKTQGLFRLR